MTENEQILNAINGLRTDFNTRMDSLETKVDSLETRIGVIEVDIVELKSDVKLVKEMAAETSRNMVMFENVLAPKVEALFDGYNANMKLYNRMYPNFSRLESQYDTVRFEVDFLKASVKGIEQWIKDQKKIS